MRASFNAALGLLNTETVSLARDGFLMWAQRVNGMRPAGAPAVTLDFAVLTFSQIADDTERQRFNSMPTTFRLRPVEVDALRSLAGRLLDRSPEFGEFRRALEYAKSSNIAL